MNSRSKAFYPSISNNDNKSTASLYEARRFFYDKTLNYIIKEYSKQVNKNTYIPLSDLYGENSLFGALDTDGDVVAPIENMSNFSSVGIGDDGSTLYLQNFVADALKDMISYLNNQILKNCYGGSSPNINNSPFYNLKVSKAYERSTNINSMYLSTANVIASKFKNKALTDKTLDAKITDYKTFTTNYIEFLKDHLSVSPVTKSRMMCYYNLSTYNNGLMFSFSNDQSGNYDKNYIKYYMDPGFLSFADACIRFGFKIDKNNPFILHADLQSPALYEYYKKYSLNGINDLFKKRYRKLYKEDLQSLKYFFIDSYNIFITNNNYYTQNLNNYCQFETKNINIKYRYPITKEGTEEYFKNFPDTFWMRLYIYLKTSELQLKISQAEFENTVKSINQYVKFGRVDEGLSKINLKFDETKGINFFDSLHEKNAMIQEAVGNGTEKIKF